MRKSKTSAVKKAIQLYIDDPDKLLSPQWHEVEITGGTNHQSVKIHVTAYKLNGIIKVITKPLWDNLSVEDARKLYDKRFKIDGGYKEKHTFQAVTSSRKWTVRLVLFLISVLLWNVWRLALAWDFFMKTYAFFEPIPPDLIRKVIAHELGDYLIRVWWRLCI
jgi:IS4 transposase